VRARQDWEAAHAAAVTRAKEQHAARLVQIEAADKAAVEVRVPRS